MKKLLLILLCLALALPCASASAAAYSYQYSLPADGQWVINNYYTLNTVELTEEMSALADTLYGSGCRLKAEEGKLYLLWPENLEGCPVTIPEGAQADENGFVSILLPSVQNAGGQSLVNFGRYRVEVYLNGDRYLGVDDAAVLYFPNCQEHGLLAFTFAKDTPLLSQDSAWRFYTASAGTDSPWYPVLAGGQSSCLMFRDGQVYFAWNGAADASLFPMDASLLPSEDGYRFLKGTVVEDRGMSLDVNFGGMDATIGYNVSSGRLVLHSDALLAQGLNWAAYVLDEEAPAMPPSQAWEPDYDTDRSWRVTGVLIRGENDLSMNADEQAVYGGVTLRLDDGDIFLSGLWPTLYGLQPESLPQNVDADHAINLRKAHTGATEEGLVLAFDEASLSVGYRMSNVASAQSDSDLVPVILPIEDGLTADPLGPNLLIPSLRVVVNQFEDGRLLASFPEGGFPGLQALVFSPVEEFDYGRTDAYLASSWHTAPEAPKKYQAWTLSFDGEGLATVSNGKALYPLEPAQEQAACHAFLSSDPFAEESDLLAPLLTGSTEVLTTDYTSPIQAKGYTVVYEDEALRTTLEPIISSYGMLMGYELTTNVMPEDVVSSWMDENLGRMCYLTSSGLALLQHCSPHGAQTLPAQSAMVGKLAVSLSLGQSVSLIINDVSVPLLPDALEEDADAATPLPDGKGLPTKYVFDASCLSDVSSALTYYSFSEEAKASIAKWERTSITLDFKNRSLRLWFVDKNYKGTFGKDGVASVKIGTAKYRVEWDAERNLPVARNEDDGAIIHFIPAGWTTKLPAEFHGTWQPIDVTLQGESAQIPYASSLRYHYYSTAWALQIDGSSSITLTNGSETHTSLYWHWDPAANRCVTSPSRPTEPLYLTLKDGLLYLEDTGADYTVVYAPVAAQ